MFSVRVDLAHALQFLLVLVRVSAALVVMPVFGLRAIPVKVKLLFSLALSATVSMGLVSEGVVAVDSTLLLVAAREVVVGLLLGTVAGLIFASVELAGDMVGMQMGFAIANVIDPQTAKQTSLVGQFQMALLVLLFFAVDGHYLVIGAMRESFALVPLGSMHLDVNGPLSLLRLAGRMFVLAVELAAPATVMLLLVNVALAVVARVVPQMNVFIVGFPLTIAVGIAVMAAAMPAFVTLLAQVVRDIGRDMVMVARSMG